MSSIKNKNNSIIRHPEFISGSINEQFKNRFGNKFRMTNAFTLIELIVVITILAILGTISFVSFNDYTKSARDSKRTSDVNSISKSIEVGIVTNGVVPTPVGGVSYTGGTSGTGTSLVNLVVGTVNKSILPNISGELKDPSSKNEYKYSTIQGKTYYQIGVEYEKDISYLDNFKLLTSTYGNKFSITKSALAATTNNTVTKLNGNYVFDPSLPSLFPIASTVSSASGGIFSPDVCFVLNNVSSNSFSSTSTNCTKKKDLSLNTFDSSLVGYWDMETTFQSGGITYLKDLTGHGLDGTGSGGISIGGTGGITGKGTEFKSSNLQNIKIPNSSLYGFQKGQDFTLNIITYISSNQLVNINTKGIIEPWGDNAGTHYPFVLRYADYSGNPAYGSVYFARYGGTSYYNPYVKSNSILNDLNKYYIFTLVKNGDKLMLYVNGNKQGSVNDTTEELQTPLILTDSLYFGSKSNSTNSYFNGIIDDVKIYNRALSDEEIKQQAQSAGF